MGLILITGPAKSGKTAAAIETVLKYPPLEAAASVRYVVPTTEAARRVEELIMERTGRPGILGNVVTTFYGLAQEFIARKGLSGKLISDIQKELTLRKLVETAEPEYLKESAEFPGFIAALDRIIGELKISLVVPESLQSALEAGRAPLSAEARKKLAELADLYRRYQEDVLFANNLHDREGLMWRALELIGTDGPALEHVIFDGFDQMNNVEREFLAALAARVSEAVMTLTYEADREEIFGPLAPVREFILSLGATERRLEARGDGQTALDHLRAQIFRTGAEQRHIPDGTVTVIEGCDRAMELEMVAMEIKRLVVESGLDLSDIALVARDPDAYREPAARILSEHGIPVEEGERPLAETALARLLICCMNIVRQGWPRDETVRLLKSEMVSDSLDAVCRVEIAAKRLGIVGGRDKWLEPWGDKDRTHRFRLAVLRRVADFEDQLNRAGSTAERTAAVRALIGGFKKREGANDRLAVQDAAAAREILSILSELESSVAIIGETDRAGWLKNLDQAIALGSYAPAKAADSVRLLPVSSLPAGGFAAVFVLGMLEKTFPRQIREEPFLRDRERRELNRHLDHALALRLPLADVERFFFYLAIGSAGERLYLSYPLTDSSAKDSLPSFYLEEVDKVLGPAARWRRDHNAMVPRVNDARSRVSLRRAVAFGLAQLAPSAAGAAADVYNALPAPERRAFARVFTDSRERPAGITDLKLLEQFADRDKIFRCTELEAYAACPFMHFCSHTLGLEEIRDEIGGLDLGGLLHEVLYRLFKELAAEHGAALSVRRLDPEATVRRAVELMEEEFEKNARLVNMPKHEATVLLHNLRMRLKRYLTAEIKKGWEGFTPTYFELEFGNPERAGRGRDALSTVEPLVLADGEGRPVAVCGRMDRVDVCGEGALVIDYKLGDSPNILRFEEGLTIQAVLYALALKKLFGIAPVGAEYRPLKAWVPDGFYLEGAGIVKRNRVLDPEAFSEKLRQCEARVVDLAERLRSGNIDIKPLICKDYCPFSDICRIDKYKLLALSATAGGEGDDE